MRTYEFPYESYGRVQILDMLSAKEKAIEQLGEMFNRFKGTGTRSWLPPAPSVVLEDGDRLETFISCFNLGVACRCSEQGCGG